MKFIMKMVIGFAALGGVAYWLLSICVRPPKRLRNRIKERFPGEKKSGDDGQICEE